MLHKFSIFSTNKKPDAALYNIHINCDVLNSIKLHTVYSFCGTKQGEVPLVPNGLQLLCELFTFLSAAIRKHYKSIFQFKTDFSQHFGFMIR